MYRIQTTIVRARAPVSELTRGDRILITTAARFIPSTRRHANDCICATLGLVAFATMAGRVTGQATFTGLGVLPGASSSAASALSANGVVVVGSSDDLAFRWTYGGGMEDLGTLPGGYSSSAADVNAAGSVVVGQSSAPGFTHRAFRWTSAEGMIDLGSLPGSTLASATGVSADGSVIVGRATGFGQRAFRWTPTQGMVQLPPYELFDQSAASDISADGSMVVGKNWWMDPGLSCFVFWPGGAEDICQYSAVKWSNQGMHTLPPPTGVSQAYAVSASGVAVGWRQPAGSNSKTAFRWGGAGPGGLGTLPGHTGSYASAVSANGSVVVGSSYGSEGIRAFRWTSDDGMMDLNEYLPTLGIDLSGWILLFATAVSADGLTMAGTGGHNGMFEAWIATVSGIISPLPGDLNCDGSTNGRDVRAFLLACFDPVSYAAAYPGCNGMLADMNGSGVVDIDDIPEFVDLLLAF